MYVEYGLFGARCIGAGHISEILKVTGWPEKTVVGTRQKFATNSTFLI